MTPAPIEWAAICLIGAISVVVYVYCDRKVPAGAVTAAAVLFLALGAGIGHFVQRVGEVGAVAVGVGRSQVSRVGVSSPMPLCS
jgi:hypothetical protein